MISTLLCCRHLQALCLWMKRRMRRKLLSQTRCCSILCKIMMTTTTAMTAIVMITECNDFHNVFAGFDKLQLY